MAYRIKTSDENELILAEEVALRAFVILLGGRTRSSESTEDVDMEEFPSKLR